MRIIVAGIHTGIGKTVCSAIICQALGYDYWKPIQAGDLRHSDSVFIKMNVTNTSCKVHPEKYKLLTPASPHYAAELDGIEIKRENIILPKAAHNLVVETAGGIMSPLANNFLNIDLIKRLGLPVILVSNNYLGSINHTLLTNEALASRNITILGIVFVGAEVASTREYILNHTQLPLLFSVPFFEKLDATTIAEFANSISVKF